MNIDGIENGYVLDHIQPGKSSEISRLLGLDALDCPVAMIKNAHSAKMGRKDIIKIDTSRELNLELVGFASPGATVNVIRGGVRVQKYAAPMPERLENVVFCRNSRCITSAERGLKQIFVLTDPVRREYRCLYCESKM
ncbi:MAG: aspartate carbamoyltransferase regulatory subunit [Firmicutes bacterium]|nr:aspartate carbamoyltransferase regulatory subunit [Bacillota bacterium]